jgi:hypothetical protein
MTNRDLLAKHPFDLDEVLAAHDYNMTTPGSEFRDVNLLRNLLVRHPLWKSLKIMLTHGAEIQFIREPDKRNRKSENVALIAYNNHKKAQENSDIRQQSLAK